MRHSILTQVQSGQFQRYQNIYYSLSCYCFLFFCLFGGVQNKTLTYCSPLATMGCGIGQCDRPQWGCEAMRDQGLGLDAQTLYEPNPFFPLRGSALCFTRWRRERGAHSLVMLATNIHAPLYYQFVLSIYWLNYVFPFWSIGSIGPKGKEIIRYHIFERGCYTFSKPMHLQIEIPGVE